MPLSGVRVVDLTRILAGPFATMLLGDLGADVIKIEHPDGGDDTRGWGPPWVSGAGGASATDGPRPGPALEAPVRSPLGRICYRCAEPIGWGGRFCPACHQPLHESCVAEIEPPPSASLCRECGSPIIGGG